MCAIFGYINRRGSMPKLDALASIVRANIQRGPHSFGVSWLDSRGRLHCYKQAGRLTDHLGVLALAREAVAMIGHLRYATHGEPAANVNNHPHPADGGWLVHNGVIANYEALVKSKRLWPVSECDSEVLGLLIERGDGPILRRAAHAIESTSGKLAMMGLWSRPGTVIVGRRGNPLHVSETSEGFYFGTLAEGLPGKVFILPDNSTRVFTARAGKWSMVVKKLAKPADRAGSWNLFDSQGDYRGG